MSEAQSIPRDSGDGCPLPSAENGALMEVLIDFAEWRGDCIEDAEWAADRYLRERAKHGDIPPARSDR